MRARFAAVIMRVDEVDSEALEVLHRRARCVIPGGQRSSLRVVDRQSRKVDARPVQIKVAAIDPEFAKPETLRRGNVKLLRAGVEEGYDQPVLVLRRVDVPEIRRMPTFRDLEPAFIEIGSLEGTGGELTHLAFTIENAGAQQVARLR